MQSLIPAYFPHLKPLLCSLVYEVVVLATYLLQAIVNTMHFYEQLFVTNATVVSFCKQNLVYNPWTLK